MDDIWIYIISIIGGFIAGVINTLAGNGSVITLGILTELVGLPASIANGTNRIGVLIQTFTSYLGLKSNVDVTLKDNKVTLLLIFTGAIIGAFAAVAISNDQFTIVYKAMMVFMLLTILVKPSRWLDPQNNVQKKIPQGLMVIIYLLLGFYGGFIQMGMGLIFLGVMVLLDGKQIMETNFLKIFIIMIFSVFVLGIFVSRGMVEWWPGLTIAIGQGTGGWVTGKYIAKSPRINKIAYYTLLIVIISVIIKMFFF